MARKTAEWIGRTDDTPPPPRVKERILRAHGNRCAITQREFGPGDTIEFDHILALTNGGENREGNLQPVLSTAHKEKSRADVRIRAKNSRVFKKRNGINSGPKRKIPGSKGTGMRKGVDGSVRFVREER
ncbi:HNH endonuclease [Rhodobacter sp. NTK016B]|uniref:HNH endonuclease n=1 Tax=Rhodobacter sp. NTK016B TaxID=2759676 RepID=UPI001A8E69FA|nr:HNH endonuclease signature motif containing protein [Rhodobacter sp. NTK016B]MBN8294538.1 HNH endonuclease [Rhodobacter sp. NTK016B]